MPIDQPDTDGERPVPRSDGVSAARERRWGLVGGLVGSLVGGGSAAVAVLLDGAPLFESGPWPSIFEEPRLLAIDVYLLAVLVAGMGFSVASLLHARRGPFPRSDAFGAGLVGALLTTLAGAILFVRVLALSGAGTR